MRISHPIATLVMLVAVAACQSTPTSDPVRDEAAIRAADARWLAAAQAHDLENTLAYWSDDAVLMVPRAPAMLGKEAIRRYVSESFAIPGFSISWTTDRVWVAKAGDLAYATGTTQVSMTTPEGKPVVRHNKGVTVWRKEPVGSWKCVVDIANSEASASGSGSAPGVAQPPVSSAAFPPGEARFAALGNAETPRRRDAVGPGLTAWVQALQSLPHWP